MQLNAPKQITWWIALVVGVIGLLGELYLGSRSGWW